MFAVLVIPIFFFFTHADVHDNDLITSLPGANFDITFKQYSGYLNPDSVSFLHYWLVESQNDPANDPLLLWLNGGPGCSSLDGLLTENGPFRVTDIYKTIEENPYAWNKLANVLYIESPQKVGFSYTTSKDVRYGDNQTALLNYNALKDFFSKFTEYNNRSFYISGESYAGIYLPTLAMYLINDTVISKQFKGMAIGNGALSDDYLTNSLPAMLYEHVMVGEREWRNMTTCCGGNGMSCDYVTILNNDTRENFNCFSQAVFLQLLPQLSDLDPYNLYDTCYIDQSKENSKRTVIYDMFLKRLGLDFEKVNQLMNAHGIQRNVQKLDSSQTYPDCYYDGITNYLQRKDVRTALHIPDNVEAWAECTNFLPRWESDYDNMAYQLKTAISAGVRIMIYNGDCDTVCNGMGDKQFIDSLGIQQMNDTKPWLYNDDYGIENAGFQTLYDGIDFISVRGSGHFVPQDRPREALQMIANFIWNEDYSRPTEIDVTPKPVTTQSTSTPQAPGKSSSLRNYFWLSILSLMAVVTSRFLFEK